MEGADFCGCRRGRAPLVVAAERGHVEVVKHLLHQVTEEHPFRDTVVTGALHAAVDTGHTGLVDIFVEAGAHPDEVLHTGASPLCHAVQAGDYVCAVTLTLWMWACVR